MPRPIQLNQLKTITDNQLEWLLTVHGQQQLLVSTDIKLPFPYKSIDGVKFYFDPINVTFKLLSNDKALIHKSMYGKKTFVVEIINKNKVAIKMKSPKVVFLKD